MRRNFLLIVFVVFFCGIAATSLAQAATSDSPTLQALLAEVRDLHQELRTSLGRMQSAQILLSRLQTQQAATTRASERLSEARSKLADAQTHQKDVRNDLKRFEDSLNDEQNLAQQKELRDRIDHLKSELEDSFVERYQANEIEAEQQLSAEQDKLNSLEAQLEELVRKVGTLNEQSGRAVR